MNSYNFKHLPPFKWYVLENFPFIEADFDALTNWQLFCKLGKEINKIIKSQNDLGNEMENVVEAFNNLQQYVEHYFDTLDLEPLIDEKLDEMIEDGTMAEIINEEIFGELNSAVEELQTKVDLIEKYPTTNIGLRRIFRFLEDSEYLSMQGGCITPNNTLICAMWDGTKNNKFYEISLATGQILKQSTYSFGWCNSVTFDNVNNVVYVAHRGETENNVSTNLKKVSILSYSDLSLITTIDFSDYVEGVYYNKDTHKLYFMNEWNQRSSYGFKIYEINQSTFEIVDTININYNQSDIDKLKIQNFAVVDDEILLISSEPQAMIVYDMDGNLVREYNLPDYVNNIYYTGEYQFIDFYNNTYYVGSGDNVSGIESINQIFKFKFNDEYINGEESEVGIRAGGSYSVSVDATSTSLNPEGTSDNPFKSINEALRYKTASRGLNVNVADGTYHGVYLRSRNNVHISGHSSSTIIKGLNIGYCNGVSVENATIEDCEFDQAGAVNITYSIVYLKSLNINDDEDRYGVNIGQFSECNLSIGVSFDVTNANEIYIRNDSLLINNSYSYKIQKHHKSSKIIGEGLIKLFQNPTDMCIGSFEIDSSWAYTEYKFYSYFDYMVVQYRIGNSHYTKRFPLISTANSVTLFHVQMSGTGTEKVSVVTIDFNDTNKLRLRYSKVFTRDASGSCSGVVNEDNDNPVNDSIIVENVYFE